MAGKVSSKMLIMPLKTKSIARSFSRNLRPSNLQHSKSTKTYWTKLQFSKLKIPVGLARFLKGVSLSSLLIRPDMTCTTTSSPLPQSDPIIPTFNPITIIYQIYDIVCVIVRGFATFFLLLPLLLTSPILPPSYWHPYLLFCLQTLGPVYVKLGQWASTRRDMLPAHLCDSLSELQTRVKPHSWQQTLKILQATFGGRYHLVFTSLEKSPVGSGCVAQVYRGKVQEGDHLVDVAVKVVHPGLARTLHLDLLVLRWTARFVTWLVPRVQWLDLEGAVEEFGELMEAQLDLCQEAGNLEVFRRNFEGSRIMFPRPLKSLCSRDVLVETWMEGKPIQDYLSDNVDTSLKRSLAHLGVNMLLKMVFTDNFYHGDLHPGNILVMDGGETLGVLDVGITASLEPGIKAVFRDTFRAIVSGEGEKVGELFLENSYNECLDRDKFIKNIAQLVENLRNQQISLDRVEVSGLLQKVFSILTEHHVRVDSSFSSVMIAIIVLEGLGRQLDPHLDLCKRAIPYLIFK